MQPKFIRYIFTFLMLSFGAASFALANEIFRFNDLVASGKCYEAENLAQQSFNTPQIYTLLGIVNLRCYNNKYAGIKYLKIAADQGELFALDLLNNLNTDEKSEAIRYQRSEEYARPIPLPPPHQFSNSPTPPPQPTYRPPTICHQLNSGVGVPPMILCN